jgi:hypothetical protein
MRVWKVFARLWARTKCSWNGEHSLVILSVSEESPLITNVLTLLIGPHPCHSERQRRISRVSEE